MDFKKISRQLKDHKPRTFLETCLKQPSEKDSFFTINAAIQPQFEKNVVYLSSPETLSVSELQGWQEEGIQVVAQTIDGDYVAGSENLTLVIPVSLYKSDIETYDLSLADFFLTYTNGAIQSQILPTN